MHTAHPFFMFMAALLKEILACLEDHYPQAWALPGDRVGLQVGSPETPVDTLLVALEASLGVVAEAQARSAQALLTHHPLIYQPLEAVREDQPVGRLLAAVLRAGLAVAACHTNLDVAPGGLNDYLAQLLELEGVAGLAATEGEQFYKLTVFTPPSYEDRLRQALCDDGVGVIGNYSHCTFAGRGQGTFRPGAGARPFRGEEGTLSRVEESRLEILVPASRLEAAVRRLKAAHPYEEPAFDLYPVKNPGPCLALGRVGRWPHPRPFGEVIRRVKEVFGVAGVRVWGRPPAQVCRVAVCGGSGGDLIATARKKGAELFLTGEVRHHQVLLGDGEDFAVLEVGHFHSEVVFMPAWARQVQNLLHHRGLGVQVAAATETPPCRFLV